VKVNKVLTKTDMGMEHSDIFTKVCLTHSSTVTDITEFKLTCPAVSNISNFDASPSMTACCWYASSTVQ